MFGVRSETAILEPTVRPLEGLVQWLALFKRHIVARGIRHNVFIHRECENRHFWLFLKLWLTNLTPIFDTKTLDTIPHSYLILGLLFVVVFAQAKVGSERTDGVVVEHGRAQERRLSRRLSGQEQTWRE